MATKRDAIRIHLTQLRERPDLEAATIGQHRAGPFAERVQAPEPIYALGAGAQHKMVRIAEDDIGAGLLHLIGVERFTRASRANGHEGRRADVASRRRERSCPRRAFCGIDCELKTGHG